VCKGAARYRKPWALRERTARSLAGTPRASRRARQQDAASRPQL